MTQPSSPIEVPPIVRRKLQQVLRGIRTYVWLEGLAILVITLGAAFWLGLSLDWLFEPPPGVRLVAIAAVLAFGAWIVYRLLLRRAFARFSDASLAVLLERRFSRLQDHVLTAVDLAAVGEGAKSYHPELVSRTHYAAAQAIANVPTRELFRRGPLIRSIIAALAFAASIPLFALAAGDVFDVWLQRIALSTEPWPRRVRLEVVGFPRNEAGERSQKLARDDKFELLVHARTDGHVVPDVVELRFRLEDGSRGRDTMIRVGEALPSRDEFQLFRYEFKQVAADMTIDVGGGDDRIRDLQLQVVERPELVGMEVVCEYPEYLHRPLRRLPVTGGMRIPEGTRLTLHAAATKPLADVRVHSSRQPQEMSLTSAEELHDEVSWDYGAITSDDVLTIHLTDTDGITCREPYRMSLSVVPDELPQVAVRLSGIGTAITPDAVLPLTGNISDDYGLERIWFAYQVNGGAAGQRPFARQPAGEQMHTELDRFDTRGGDQAAGDGPLQLEPGQSLRLSIQATDRYDLTDAPRAGSSPQFELDVVTVAQLMAMMERRELELRQRFEAIIAKLTDTRNLLGRVEFSDAPARAPVDVSAVDVDEASEAASDSPGSDAARVLSRRRLRVAGSLQNVTQSAHEVLGVADAFDDIHDQLENNRVDNSELKYRLREQIALPLRQLGESRMTELESRLQLVQQHVADMEAGPAALANAVKTADAVLVEMQQILERMLELESYNEVVAMLRGIIQDQHELRQQTIQKQTERLQDLFSE